MQRSVSRNLYLTGFALLMLATVVVIASGVTNANATPTQYALARDSLLVGAIGALLGTIAWIGALVRMARLRRWGWFAALLLINVAMSLYIFRGPDEPP